MNVMDLLVMHYYMMIKQILCRLFWVRYILDGVYPVVLILCKRTLPKSEFNITYNIISRPGASTKNLVKRMLPQPF